MLIDTLLSDLTALGTVIIIDIVLAGDNALVVGMAAAGLPHHQQRKVIVIGIAIALIARILFSIIAVQLLGIIGLLLAGGLLLLWVAWKMWREICLANREQAKPEGAEETHQPRPVKSFSAAVWQIAVADISMSLDNVLAVAGAARHNVWVLVFGLLLSISLMGVAATLIARWMQRYPWLSYIGLITVTYVALSMIYEGGHQVFVAIE